MSLHRGVKSVQTANGQLINALSSFIPYLNINVPKIIAIDFLRNITICFDKVGIVHHIYDDLIIAQRLEIRLPRQTRILFGNAYRDLQYLGQNYNFSLCTNFHFDLDRD